MSSTVCLNNPKYSHNVAGILRACSCFGIDQLIYTGDRINIDVAAGERLPREERMKGYKDVKWFKNQRPFDFTGDQVPVAIELHETATPLTIFEHPKNAVYVFGPEDGSISQMMRRFCHHFVFIPSFHCLNLSAAVNVILADRMMKRQMSGEVPFLSVGEMLKETRGYGAPSTFLDDLGWDGK